MPATPALRIARPATAASAAPCLPDHDRISPGARPVSAPPGSATAGGPDCRGHHRCRRQAVTSRIRGARSGKVHLPTQAEGQAHRSAGCAATAQSYRDPRRRPCRGQCGKSRAPHAVSLHPLRSFPAKRCAGMDAEPKVPIYGATEFPGLRIVLSTCSLIPKSRCKKDSDPEFRAGLFCEGPQGRSLSVTSVSWRSRAQGRR
jgi:hypothetical protein